MKFRWQSMHTQESLNASAMQRSYSDSMMRYAQRCAHIMTSLSRSLRNVMYFRICSDIFKFSTYHTSDLSELVMELLFFFIHKSNSRFCQSQTPLPEARPFACAHTTVSLLPLHTPIMRTWHSLPRALGLFCSFIYPSPSTYSMLLLPPLEPVHFQWRQFCPSLRPSHCCF